MKTTHTFNGNNLVCDDIPHFLQGVQCQLHKRTAITPTGYDCLVLVPLDTWVTAIEEHNKKYSGALNQAWGKDQWMGFLRDNEMLLDDATVIQEASLTDELDAI